MYTSGGIQMVINREEKIREIKERKEMIQKKLDAAFAKADRKLPAFNRLQNRMYVCVLGLVTVSALILTVFNVRMARTTVAEALEEASMPIVDLTAEIFDTKLQSYVSSLTTLGQNTNLTNPAMPDEIKSLIINGKQKDFGYLYGEMVLFNSSKGSSLNPDLRASVLENGYYIDAPHTNHNNDFVFEISVPLIDAYKAAQTGATSAETVGVLTFAFDPAVLSNILNLVELGDNSKVYIINQEGTIIASKDYNQVLNGDKNAYGSDEKLVAYEQSMLAGERGNVTFTRDGQDYLLSYGPIESFGWAVAVDIYQLDFAQRINSSRYMSFGIGLVILFVCAILVHFGTQMIVKPIENLTYVAKEMAKGNFDVRVNAKSSSECGILAESLILTLQNLKSTIRDITRVLKSMENKDFDVYTEAIYVGEFAAIEHSIVSVRDSVSEALHEIKIVGQEVYSGADQVASASQALAQGATEQASAVQELNATIIEINEATKKNTENARNAAIKVSGAGSEIETSNEQMQKLMLAMEDMTVKSAEITKIVKTIDDIAFQTNILALNAAVEAARAGQAGKGFAVVADEVRNLASKSAEAAKNTTALIEETTKAIAQGSEIARETAESLINVVNATQEAVSEVNEISHASELQATSVGQITTGIDQISAVVQTNSATSEQSAAAAEQLSSQASSLDQLLSQFNINK